MEKINNLKELMEQPEKHLKKMKDATEKLVQNELKL